MIHFVARSGTGGVTIGATVGFNPGGGSYAGTSINVTITVTNATKLRWKINNDAYTTVNATTAIVAVGLTLTGKSLYADALDSGGSVLETASAFYQKPEGGQ